MITRNGKIVPFFFGCRRPRFINPHLLRHPRVARDAPILASDLETTGFLPPILDQGQLGSCTCNAKAVQFYFAAAKAGLSPVLVSRLMLYYMVRDEEAR